MLTNKPKLFRSTGLSDFHKMIASALKIHFRKFPPRVISYRDFSNYDNANINSLNEVFCESKNTQSFLKDPDYFYKVCTEVLNKHAPPKKKYVRGNNKPFMNKAISKAIMLRRDQVNLLVYGPDRPYFKQKQKK